jgi:hypothetical protein
VKAITFLDNPKIVGKEKAIFGVNEVVTPLKKEKKNNVFNI